MNDLIRLVCERAVEKFGGKDTFNAANFSVVFSRIAGVRGGLDGHVVRAILTGRPDIEVLSGGCYFRLIGGRG